MQTANTKEMLKESLAKLLKLGNRIYLQEMFKEIKEDSQGEAAKSSEVTKGKRKTTGTKKPTKKAPAHTTTPEQKAAIAEWFAPVGDLGEAYQSWYSVALPVVKQVLPERYSEFGELYKNEKRKDIDYMTYGLSDYLLGTVVRRAGINVFDPYSVFEKKFKQQLDILRSCVERLDLPCRTYKAYSKVNFSTMN